MVEELLHPDHRETTGERLVRIETILGSMSESLKRHITDEEKELADTKRMITENIAANSAFVVGMEAMKRDMHEMQLRMKSLESEVQILVKNKTFALAWASGAGSILTLLSGGAVWMLTRLFL